MEGPIARRIKVVDLHLKRRVRGQQDSSTNHFINMLIGAVDLRTYNGSD